MIKQTFHLIVLLVVVLLASLSVKAQDTPQDIARQFVEIGDEIYFEQRAPEVAKEMYIQAVQTDPDNIKANFMTGRTIMETINKGEATAYFLKVYALQPDYQFDILYKIGRAYQYGLEFAEAINFYNQYLQKLDQQRGYEGDDKVPVSQVRRRLYECENGIDFINNSRNLKITNLGSSINSNSRDYAPVINADETMMIFTSRRQDKNLNEDVFDDNFHYEDIFISYKENGEWTPAKNIGEPINTLYFDSNLGLSADGKQLYLYKDGEEGDGDIYVSELQEDDTWSEPEPVSKRINSSYGENSVSISPDGNTLYFSSNRPGSYGGYDIYRCEKNSRGEWGKVYNLGQQINTPYDEEGMFIGHDGKTLYFSSKGHKGMGGYDIFKSVYDDSTQVWSEPVNMGYPINTPDDDIFFVTTKDEKTGYYATVRGDGLGYLDIYKVEIPDLTEEPAAPLAGIVQVDTSAQPTNEVTSVAPPVTIGDVAEVQPVQLLLKVEDANTEEALDATVSLKNSTDGRTLLPVPVATGIYRFDISEEQASDYIMTVQQNGYVYKSLEVSVPAAAQEPQEFRRKVALSPIVAGYRKVLDFVYFDFNSVRLREESQDELNRLRDFMMSNIGTSIEIAGHTDNIGTRSYNKSLSQARAQAIVNFLIQEGVNIERVIAKGYGESDPIASNDDEKDGRELNRRVEMRVLNTPIPVADQ